MSKRVGDRKNKMIKELLEKHPDTPQWLIDQVIIMDVYSLFQLWHDNYEFKHAIDLGANRGVFTYVFTKLFPEAEVFAFEPIRECCDFFHRLNGDNDKVTLIPSAVSYKDGASELYFTRMPDGSPNWGCATLVPPTGRKAEVSESMTIPTMSVKTFKQYLPADRSQAYLKMDIEGYEAYLLRERRELLFDWKAFGCELHLNLITELGVNNHAVNDFLISAENRYQRTHFVGAHWASLITRFGPLEMTFIN